jgi:protein DGCR14
MFAPDADESPYHQSLSTADASARGDPKAILHSNTRLPSSFEDNFPSTSSAVPPSPARSRVAAAIAGTPYRPHVETPRIQGFGFVDALPSPTPEQLGPKRVKELMTWGTLLGTPRVVGGDDTAADEASSAATPFRINPPTSRDALGRKLGSAASKSLRAKASLLTPRPSSTRTKKGDMPPPSSTPRRAAGLDLLSPAGRNLLDRTKMGGSGLVARDNPWSSESARKRGKELDLGKVGWSPRDTPLTKRR